MMTHDERQMKGNRTLLHLNLSLQIEILFKERFSSNRMSLQIVRCMNVLCTCAFISVFVCMCAFVRKTYAHVGIHTCVFSQGHMNEHILRCSKYVLICLRTYLLA